MKKTIVIMAAGMGSRFGGLKQIEGLGPSNEILMEYSIFDALKAGFDKVVFIIKPAMKEDFEERVGKKLRAHIEVKYAFQTLTDLPDDFAPPEGRVKPWGTSHAILSARDVVNEPFAVFNADDYYGPQAFRVMGDYLDKLQSDRVRAAMVGYQIKNTLSRNGTVTRGLCQTQDNSLTSVKEIAKIGYNSAGSIEYYDEESAFPLGGEEPCSMNFWGFTPQLFSYLEREFPRFLQERGAEMKSEWLIPDTVDQMIRQKVTQVAVLESQDRWFGMTYPEDKPLVVEQLKKLTGEGLYPSPLF